MNESAAVVAPDPRDWRAILRAVRHPAFVASKFRTTFVKTRFGIESVRDAVIDRRFGGNCGGSYVSRFEDLGSTGTSSAHYYRLGQLFRPENVTIRPEDVLVDVGCGKGRVINFWLDQGLHNRIIGLELDPRFAAFASQRLSAYPNVEILCGDAVELLPRDGTVYYLFNPFRRPTVERFKNRLLELHGAGSDITILYYMCQHVDVFEEDPAWTVTPASGRTFHRAAVIRPASRAPSPQHQAR